jgi:hypothetical protein
MLRAKDTFKFLITGSYILGVICIVGSVVLGIVSSTQISSAAEVGAAGILLTLITAMYQNTDKKLDDIVILSDASKEVSCRLLREATRSFDDITVEKLALSCTKSIFLMFIGDRGPGVSYRVQVANVLQFVRRNRRYDLNCKHLVIGSPATFDWIKEQAETMAGCVNFDLACIDSVDDSTVHKLGLSVQIFDGDQVLLIDPGKYQSVNNALRDIWFKSAPVNSMFCSYYDSIWNLATLVVDQGQVRRTELESLRKRYQTNPTTDSTNDQSKETHN